MWYKRIVTILMCTADNGKPDMMATGDCTYVTFSDDGGRGVSHGGVYPYVTSAILSKYTDDGFVLLDDKVKVTPGPKSPYSGPSKCARNKRAHKKRNDRRGQRRRRRADAVKALKCVVENE